jgi:hypothetical protein
MSESTLDYYDSLEYYESLSEKTPYDYESIADLLKGMKSDIDRLEDQDTRTNYLEFHKGLNVLNTMVNMMNENGNLNINTLINMLNEEEDVEVD